MPLGHFYRRFMGGASSDVNRRVCVGIAGEPATTTQEFGLALAISLLAMTAFATGSTRVSRIDRDNRDAKQPSLVFDKAAELSERPSAHLGSLSFAEPGSVTDAGQFLDRQTASSVFGKSNERFADNVIRVGSESSLAPADPFHGPPGVLPRAPFRGPHLATERTSRVEVFDANRFNVFAGNELPVAGRHQSGYAHIDPDKFLGLNRSRFGKVYAAKQIELVAAIDQITLAFDPVEPGLLILAENGGDNLPPRKGKQANPIHALEAHQSFIVGHRAQGLEDRASGFIPLKTVNRFGNGADSHLGRQAELLPKFPVAKPVNRRLTESFGGEPDSRRMCRGGVEGSHGIKKMLPLRGIGQDGYLNG